MFMDDFFAYTHGAFLLDAAHVSFSSHSFSEFP